MSLLQIIILALVQGIAELLPISSSAHVIAAEKMLGLDPTAPEMTFLLVMLHTGTMFAVIGYFWKTWRARYFASRRSFLHILRLLIIATLMTGVIGVALVLLIEKLVLGNAGGSGEIEHLFGNPYVMAGGLAAAGILIIVSGLRPQAERPLAARESAWIGAVQGLCLPFRGFSRSGSTISAGLLAGVDRFRAEEFSFALAVILTPPVIAKEAWRLFKAQGAEIGASHGLFASLAPGLFGMVCSFGAGWLALRWLSRWLEEGRWHYFGFYCLAAALAVLVFLR